MARSTLEQERGLQVALLRRLVQRFIALIMHIRSSVEQQLGDGRVASTSSLKNEAPTRDDERPHPAVPPPL